MKVLMITYEYPPLNSGGSHRPFRFSQELSTLGLEPIVLTVDPSHFSEDSLDNSLSNEQNGVQVIRTPLDNPSPLDRFASSYYFNLVGTEAKRWRRHLTATATDLFDKNPDIKAVYITAPPFSIAELGLDIAEQLGLPSILDMRDAWSNWCVAPYASRIHYHLLRKLEAKCMKQATAVVATSDQTLKDFQALSGAQPASKFHLITNSYTESISDFKSVLPLKRSEGKKLVIGYVGSFYYSPYQRDLMFKPWWKKKPHQYLQFVPRKEDWLYRSPYFLFKTLQQLKEEVRDLSSQLEIQFVGNQPDWLPEMIKECGIEDLVSHLGKMSHTDALAFQKNCDALLITSSKVIGGQDYSIAGKTFEYISTQKPIIAFVAEGAQKRLLEKTGLALMFNPSNIKESADTLKKVLSEGIELRPSEKTIKELHISHTAKQLEALIRTVAKSHE